jgi:GNAT superfamily N-acetyltransferase
MEIRRAQPHQVALVAEVLRAAAEALVQRGQSLWDPRELTEAAVSDDVRGGMYYLACDDDGPVGVFRFELEDVIYWPEVGAGSSAFVHRLAVHPRAQGHKLAHTLLSHAVQLARAEGRRYLRLDCSSGRPKLRGVYEQFGFRLHSQKQFRTAVVDRFELEVMRREV